MRRFEPTALPEGKLERLLELASIAPSVGLSQPWRFLGLGRITMPATIDYSAVMAVHTLWLAARAEGIGMGWVSILDATEMAEILDTPPEWTLIGYFCLG